jgi:hypothetical protein
MRAPILCLTLALALALSGCAAHQATRVCRAEAHRSDPDEEPTTQGHDRAQELMGACMESRGLTFDWSDQRCDREYPRTIVKGGCYRRSR